jgi:hypothetical protein
MGVWGGGSGHKGMGGYSVGKVFVFLCALCVFVVLFLSGEAGMKRGGLCR